MPRSYSQDFRKRVIGYVERGNSCNSTAIRFEIAANTVRNWYKRYKSEGHYLARRIGGKKGRVTSQDVELYVSSNPNFTLLEMGTYFNMSSVGAYYWLKQLGFSYKKDFSYLEASQEKRDKYQEVIKDTPIEHLVYIDESGIEINICKDRGWGKKSEKLIGKKSGKYYNRTNIIAGYVNKECIAPMIFNGTCNRQLFESWVGEFLIKELKPGQVVVMDNAAFGSVQISV